MALSEFSHFYLHLNDLKSEESFPFFSDFLSSSAKKSNYFKKNVVRSELEVSFVFSRKKNNLFLNICFISYKNLPPPSRWKTCTVNHDLFIDSNVIFWPNS